MTKDVGTIVSKMNQPSPSGISFVVTSSIVRTGQFVEVDFQDGTLIALVNDVYKTNKYFENADSVKQFEASGTKLFEQFPTQEWEYLVADAKPLGVFTQEGIKRPSFPVAPGMKVKIATDDNLKKFLGIDASGLHLGKLEFHDVEMKLNLSRLFQKHLSILAMSGSGKSHSISVLLEELLLRKKEFGRIGVVLFDVHGEYTSFAIPPEKSNSPYLDFSSVTRLVKGSDVRIALSKTDARAFHAMIPGISQVQMRELQGVLNKLHRDMNEGNGPFGLDDIKKELLKTVTDGKGRENVISPLSAWLNELDNMHLFAKTDNPSIPDLVRPGTLTIVDLSDLIDSKRKQLIVAHFARKLFNDRRNKKIPPVLLVLEEAHQFIPQFAQKGEAVSKGPLATIAREGRKFGCSLCLISQRPVHLDNTVLSQCNSNLFLRITNPNDLKHIGESSEGIDEKSLKLITSLKVGDALLVGEAVNFPVFFRVRERKTLKSRHEKSLEDSAKEFESEKAEALKEAESYL